MLDTQDMDKSIKILLAEDDRGHAELVQLNLARSGIHNEVVHFENGRQLLEFLVGLDRESNLDGKYLVILDIHMPEMNGVQVLSRLKSREETQNIPIIVLTTAGDEEDVQYCYELGCNAFIAKPMDYEAFSRTVQELGLFLKMDNMRLPRNDNARHTHITY